MYGNSSLIIPVLFALAIFGCDQSKPVPQPSQTFNKAPVSPRNVNPWVVTSSEIMALVVAKDDELDDEGRLVAITLHGKDQTLADLAHTEAAKRLERINAHSAKLSDADMAYLADFPKLKKLELNVNPKITDESLQHLNGLGELRILSLFYCPQLNGSGFEHLAELDQLVILDIGNNENIADESLIHLQQIDSLRILLASPLHGITDEGVKNLSQLGSLRRLMLSGDQITDGGIQHLASLNHLEVLTLSGAQLTETGIARLQQALPDCQIQR